MQLHGRDREIAATARALDEVRGGRARVLGVLGEAGLGKSALLAAIGERSRAGGLLVLEGRAVEHERGLPFGVADDALRDHAEPPEPAADAPAQRLRCHYAIRAELERLGGERPLALILDDLHWADEASIELVLLLLRRPLAVPHLLAFAARPVGPAARLLDAARGAPGWEQLALEPLGHDDALGLLADVADPLKRERIVRDGGGNPLFLRELTRVPDGALPPTIAAAVRVEADALDPEARSLIEGAAVAGDRFDPELAAAATGLGVEAALAALDRLAAADLVRPLPGPAARAFQFRHPLVRRAVYDGAAPGWRLAAHERAAALLADRGAAPVVRAYHVARCSRVGDAAAVALLREAAEASAAVSPAAAADWYGAALRLLPDSDREQRSVLLAAMASALTGAGRHEDAREALLEAISMSGRRLDLVVACARIESRLGLHAAARRRLLAARATAPPESLPALAFELAARAFHEGRVTELRQWAEPAMTAAAGDPPLLAGAEALAAVGALWGGDPGSAVPALDRATARLAEIDDEALAGRLAAAGYVGVAQSLCERFTAAAETSARALAIARRNGQEHALVMLHGLRALALLTLLKLDEAAREADQAEDAARALRLPHLLHSALWIRALVADARGETDQAERAAREAAGLAGALEPSRLARTAACDFAALRGDREPERALREMVAAAGPRLEHADPTWRSRLLLRLVRLAIAAGALDAADRYAGDAAAHSARVGLPAGAVRATLARAEVLLARGQPAPAAELAQRALAAAERIPAPLDALEARLLLGRALAANGRTDAAKAAFQRAAADAAASGARRLHDAAARGLRRHGSRVSARTRRAAGADATLTERERDVAELVSQGHSNKQVAARLYLSEKTIENTLTRVYTKLGVRSRVQLARTLVEPPVRSALR
jgi:DNA-binding CsgD family transcriptional regulator